MLFPLHVRLQGDQLRGPPLPLFGNQLLTLFVVNLLKLKEFLIDAGSEVSLIPAHYYDKVRATMVAANDQAIRTYGSRDVNLKFGKFRFS